MLSVLAGYGVFIGCWMLLASGIGLVLASTRLAVGKGYYRILFVFGGLGYAITYMVLAYLADICLPELINMGLTPPPLIFRLAIWLTGQDPVRFFPYCCLLALVASFVTTCVIMRQREATGA